MQIAAFNAVCPYEVGDKIEVAIPAPAGRTAYSVVAATITDIACTHFIKSGKIIFAYELDNSGQYALLADLRSPGEKQ